jgi:hypothetical protein
MNLKERETALDEKEKIILELRSTTRTLENFRFVLDHRLQQLSAERGPITAHIEGIIIIIINIVTIINIIIIIMKSLRS